LPILIENHQVTVNAVTLSTAVEYVEQPMHLGIVHSHETVERVGYSSSREFKLEGKRLAIDPELFAGTRREFVKLRGSF
jgi:hypothetical protein